MRKQKEGMRVQYAREIEAAQAQLGEREAALGYEHLQALQHLRDENEKGNQEVILKLYAPSHLHPQLYSRLRERKMHHCMNCRRGWSVRGKRTWRS